MRIEASACASGRGAARGKKGYVWSARGAQQRAERQQARRQEAKRQEGGVAFGRHAPDYSAAFAACASRCAADVRRTQHSRADRMRNAGRHAQTAGSPYGKPVRMACAWAFNSTCQSSGENIC